MDLLLAVLALAAESPPTSDSAAPPAAAAAPAVPPAKPAAEMCAPLDAATVTGWFDQWNLALASLDVDKVAARYWPDAVLLANAGTTPRTSPKLIHDYFSQLLMQHPRARLESHHVQIGCNLAIDAGRYTFSLMNDAGSISDLPAIFTLVYQYRNGSWKILHHDSAALTDGAAPATPHPDPAALAAAAHAVSGESHGPEPSAKKLKSRRMAKVDVARDGALTKSSSGRSSWSVMFLNQTGSPDVEDFYPKEARARGEHGVIALRVCADPHGALAGDPEILKTSGSADLDAAAASWARAAHWVPATENGSAVEGCTKVSVQFGS